jgi:hypothetical protein
MWRHDMKDNDTCHNDIEHDGTNPDDEMVNNT